MVRKDGAQRDRATEQHAAATTTLGAHVPGSTTFSIPDVSTFYWTPCIHRALGTGSNDWMPHVYFINDSRAPRAACFEHRGEATSTSAPAPGGPAAVTAAVTPSVAAPSGVVNAAAPPDDPKASVADFSRVQRGGKPPWADDMKGRPLWERVGGPAGAALREWYEERAAIGEYLGNLARAHAEHNAYELLIRHWGERALHRPATR